MTWEASLSLNYRRVSARTTCARRHRGPLLVQKALYPEGPRVCHSIVVHPPGGIAGGDRLSIDVGCESGAHALITTPAATKWYKAAGAPSAQTVRLTVGGALEWLPQEAIVFDAAEVNAETSIALAAGGATIGWDMVVLARAAMGERFAHGSLRQTIRFYEHGRLAWLERVRLAGGDALLGSPVGLRGARAFGCLWAYGPRWQEAQLDALRAAEPSPAITVLAPRLLVARALADTAAALRAAFEALWLRLRPLVFEGLAPLRPRIWAT
jgi:urease accessory protein